MINASELNLKELGYNDGAVLCLMSKRERGSKVTTTQREVIDKAIVKGLKVVRVDSSGKEYKPMSLQTWFRQTYEDTYPGWRASANGGKSHIRGENEKISLKEKQNEILVSAGSFTSIKAWQNQVIKQITTTQVI